MKEFSPQGLGVGKLTRSYKRCFHCMKWQNICYPFKVLAMLTVLGSICSVAVSVCLFLHRLSMYSLQVVFSCLITFLTSSFDVLRRLCLVIVIFLELIHFYIRICIT